MRPDETYSKDNKLTFFSQAKVPSTPRDRCMDIIGIGIGPSNLSLSALLSPLRNLNTVFFDKTDSLVWHKGLLFPEAELQVHYLKDLVSLVDPTNPFSFINFLSTQKRLYSFITANFPRVSRKEFSEYFHWACERMKNVRFRHEVKEIELKNDSFIVSVDHNGKTFIYESPTVVMGIGLRPRLPAFAQHTTGDTLYHASEFLEKSNDFNGKSVAVVGGGQTGAEIIRHLLTHYGDKLEKLTWLSRRENFLPIDESPFVNDLFTPNYSNYFYAQAENQKTRLLIKQRLFSDGISPRTLEDIYRDLYKIKFVSKKPLLFSLIPNVSVEQTEKQHSQWLLHFKDNSTLSYNTLHADIIILCTGYQYVIPDFLKSIENKIQKNDSNNLHINKDYSLNLDSTSTAKLFIQNGALHSHGVADPNLSLMAWRSATIINAALKNQIYCVDEQNIFLNWKNHSETLKNPTVKLGG